MEFDEDNYQEQEDDYVEIYSGRAIFWFSFFTPLVGSILLMLNLRAAGYKRAVYYVLAFIIGFIVVTDIAVEWYISTYKPEMKLVMGQINNKLLGLCIMNLVLNILAALILSQYFFKKYFPDNDYYPKSITTPLLITILVILTLNMLGLNGPGM
jgi:hypothetical protein